jgi:hypothetical protein
MTTAYKKLPRDSLEKSSLSVTLGELVDRSPNRTARTNDISLGVGLNRINRSSRHSRLKAINGIRLLSRINRITGRLGAEG